MKPRSAEMLMQHTQFRETIDIATIQMSRYRSAPPCRFHRSRLLSSLSAPDCSVDKVLNRLALKYKSAAYNLLRCNCNHFTEELCMALCGKSIPEWCSPPPTARAPHRARALGRAAQRCRDWGAAAAGSTGRPTSARRR